MAIREFSPEGARRAKIAFLGDMPKNEDLQRFRDRQYLCELLSPEDLRDAKLVGELDAIVWTQSADKPNSLPRELREVVSGLLDHDVRVYIRVATNDMLQDTPRTLVVNALIEDAVPVANLRPDEWQAVREGLRERLNSFLSPSVYIFDTASTWGDIANLVCDRPADPPPTSELSIEEDFLRRWCGSEDHEQRVLLLRRSFWNCSELRLAPLDGGMSGAPVFKAYASLDAGLVPRGAAGAFPRLYFVKIGPRKKIIDEYDKYCGQILEYVPFHLGPRLRRDRCNLGSSLGILVGDFVEGAEPLVACARGGRHGHAISNLFDKTLGGWRKQARPDKTRSLRDYLENKWCVEGSSQLITLSPERAEIVRTLGGDVAVEPLKEIFERLGNTAPLVAPAHGDMHATNVLVRHGDAILIDFEKLEEHYPLTYDPASLEGGLLVEGFIEDIKKGRLKSDELVKLIEPLYEKSALKRCQTTFCRPDHTADWYYNAVNQIRTLSWPAENRPGQYALTLALCLIRKGCNPHAGLTADAPNTLRAIAFFFGQKILRAMTVTGATVSRARRVSRER
jgi:hypothetical protein